MSNETTENFWAVWNNLQWTEPESVFYRLYHNDDGTPILYSMDQLPHAYVEIDSKTFWNANMSVRVVDGKLIFKTPGVTVNKLKPSDLVGTACSPNDVCIIVPENQPNQRWITTTNEIN
jgi:hypothetical protein